MQYQIEISGLQKLIKKLESATRAEVIVRSMDSGGLLLAGWSKKNRLTGPRPKYLGVKTGRLRSSITAGKTQRSGNEYTTKIGTNVVYARIHEFGGMTGRGHKVFIPARPFLGPSMDDRGNQRKIIDIFTKNINEALNK